MDWKNIKINDGDFGDATTMVKNLINNMKKNRESIRQTFNTEEDPNNVTEKYIKIIKNARKENPTGPLPGMPQFDPEA